jgi:RNA polymerase sigma-70 factor (ECF subfamily)
MSQTGDSVDAAIRQAFDAGLHERAATLTIEEYGPELFGFVLSQLRDREAASEVFSEFSEAFWKALPTFEWRCSIRTFAYKLLRRTAGHYRERARRRAYALPHPELSQLSVAVERVRTATLAYQRTDVKDRFQELRAQLSEEDQSLLVLRVDRGLSWRELAEVMLGDEHAPSAERLAVEAARLRKRFQLAKDRLRALVVEAGLLETE